MVENFGVVEMGKKKQKTVDYTYTQVLPVVEVSDPSQLDIIANLQGICRAQTYNKLGSLQGWGLHWKEADKLVRPLCPQQNVLPGKLREWAINDCFKAICAQQEAAKVYIQREIYQKLPLTENEKKRKYWYRHLVEQIGKKAKKSDREEVWNSVCASFPECSDEQYRKKLFKLLETDPTLDHWLHRTFRRLYVGGHSFVRNQIVYQGQGYKPTRVKRSLIKLEVQSLERGKKITLLVKSQRIPTKQIRVIKNSLGKYELHTGFTYKVVQTAEKPKKTIGLDKGYTEGFYSSENVIIAPNLGKTLTKKTAKICVKNKNRSRLFQHAQKLKSNGDKKKAENIYFHNLGKVTKNNRLRKEKATIKCMIRQDLNKYITEPTLIVAENLSNSITGFKQARSLNRKLNQWIKGELQESLEVVGRKTGSTVTLVNCAYTSQVDSLTGTLLGSRKGDCFTRFTGDVLQSDYNASCNIKNRKQDSRILRYMSSEQVRAVLLDDTIRYLHSIGETVNSAIQNNWLAQKFHKQAISLELSTTHRGSGYVEIKMAGSPNPEDKNDQYLPAFGNQQQLPHEYVDLAANKKLA